MEIIAGALNKNWLANKLQDSEEHCTWVKAAVAYANGTPKLINLCLKKNIRLSFWGRYDYSVPVSINILKGFLKRKSPNHVCRLIPECFHPKVIWWIGYGVYIGSANLTENGWFRNIECGLFLTEAEIIENGLSEELERFFDLLDQYSHPLSQEIVDQLQEVADDNKEIEEERKKLREDFRKKRKIPELKSLIEVDVKGSDERLKEAFLKEWYSTFQILRDIGDRVSSDDNRPAWIMSNVPRGVQADQFLHAYYYNRVRDGHQYPYRELHKKNSQDPEAAFVEAIGWWKSLNKPPTDEDRTIYEWAPFLRDHLSRDKLTTLTSNEFREVCDRIWAMRNHSLRVENLTYGLAKNTPPKNEDECIKLLAEYLLRQQSKGGRGVLEVIDYVLHGGLEQDTPTRLWEATRSDKWYIPHLGISSLGEMVGWAMPDLFAPRNGRTSKALTALGYEVTIHTGA